MLNWIRNYKKSTKKLTPSNVLNFIQAIWRKWTISEIDKVQFYYRVTQAPVTCLESKQCPCFCDLPDKLYEPEECEEGCYPKWIETIDFLIFLKEKDLDPNDIIKLGKDRLKDFNYE